MIELCCEYLSVRCIWRYVFIILRTPLVRKRTLNHLLSLIKWLSVCLRTQWLWVRVLLKSLKLQISCLFRARSSFTFRQLQSVDSLWYILVCNSPECFLSLRLFIKAWWTKLKVVKISTLFICNGWLGCLNPYFNTSNSKNLLMTNYVQCLQ